MGGYVVCVLFLWWFYRVCHPRSQRKAGSAIGKDLRRSKPPGTKPMNCGSDESGLKHYLVYIRACAKSYAAYHNWKDGDPILRGYHMHIHKRDWEIAGALYRYYRRWEYIRKAANEHFGKAS